MSNLRYVALRGPGISRERVGERFQYRDASGRLIRDERTVERIRSLAIPPAYERVWISPLPEAHLQAVGLDKRGRRQYRYHPAWRALRDETKFHRIVSFASRLPRLRARILTDLATPHLSREKVLAAAVALLEATRIRVGNDTYARQNHHFGLTTLLEKHVHVRGDALRFQFIGKSGVKRSVAIQHPRLARVVRRLLDVPGQELFRYVDAAGRPHRIHSHDVNAYIAAAMGETFTAKDIRTWSATVSCALVLSASNSIAEGRRGPREVLAAVKTVAQSLGNTPAVCRKSYIHPKVIELYRAGRLQLKATVPEISAVLKASLRAEERAVLSLLREAMAQATKGPTREKAA